MLSFPSQFIQTLSIGLHLPLKEKDTVENDVLKDIQQQVTDSERTMWCNKGAVLKDDIYI